MPGWMIVAIIIGTFAIGFYNSIKRESGWQRSIENHDPAWLWFSTVPDHDDLVRVGLTAEEPEMFLPRQATLLYKQYCEDKVKTLKEVDYNLRFARHSDGIYEAEVAMAYISHLQGEW